MRENWWGTGALIAASAVAFAAEALAGLPVREWGAKSWAIWAGEWHRLLAPNFIHAGVPHLAVNMIALYNFGRIVEDLAGTTRLVFVYLFSGCAGFLASLWYHPESPAVGASAAVFGLMGYTIHYRLRRLPLRWLPLDSSFLTILALNAAAWIALPNIDHAGHAAGFSGGLLAASVAGIPPFPPFRGGRVRRAWIERAAAAALAAFVFWAGLSPLSFAERVAGIAPQAGEAIRARYGKYFAPYVATSAGLYWIDPSQPGAEWRPVYGVVPLPPGRPLTVGLFWSWSEGRRAEAAMRYTVTWERERAGAWEVARVETGEVSRPDDPDGGIYRRGLLVAGGAAGGRWRVRVEGGGAIQFMREFIVVEQ